jgi:hypothetical protein
VNRLKAQLEKSVDEAEESCEREKRAKVEQEKARRKVSYGQNKN